MLLPSRRTGSSSAGRAAYSASRTSSPGVGDWVEVELTDEGKGYVVKVQPRKNSLVRPPLANLDQLVLVVSIADPAPNAFVLDQLIAIAEYQDIEPVIVVTKCDLADPSDFAKIYTDAGFTVCLTRTLEHQGIEQVMQVLQGKTSAFCGNSGAGKSTLLNAIDPRLALSTGDISQKLGRGRHTTRHVELFELPQGGYVADTPGFSAVDLEKFQVILKDELAGCFREMRPYEGKWPGSPAAPTPRRRAAPCWRRCRRARLPPAATRAMWHCMSRPKISRNGR